MPKIHWKHSIHGGWFCIDSQGNYWRRSANREVVTVTTPEDKCGTGWTPEIAWRSLQEEAS